MQDVEYSNPYTAGSAIEQRERFFGRLDILEEIRREIVSESGPFGIRLRGQRRMGKTSILRVSNVLLADIALEAEYYVAGELITIEQLLGMLVREILRPLRDPRDLPEEFKPYTNVDMISKSQFLEQFLPLVVKTLGKRRLFVMFDEFENLTTPKVAPLRADLISVLNDLFHSSLPIGVLFVIGRTDIELGQDFSGLFRTVRNLKVSFMSRGEAREALVTPSDNFLKFAPDAVERVYNLTNGHPPYVNGFGHILFER